jgi:Pericentrin-AKAP-450 domain of centrosomal targeting protein
LGVLSLGNFPVGDIDFSNKADLHLLEEMGIYPDRAIRQKRPKLRSVGLMMVAIARMRLGFLGDLLMLDG